MKTYFFYTFANGYRTGACRLSAKEVRELEKVCGELMRKEAAPEIWWWEKKPLTNQKNLDNRELMCYNRLTKEKERK